MAGSPPPERPSGSARRVALGAALLVAFLALLPFYVATARSGADFGAERGMDFRAFHESVRSWAATGDLYPDTARTEVLNLNNPHTTVAVYGWTARLPYPEAFLFFAALSFVLLLAAVPFMVAAAGSGTLASLAVALVLLAWMPTLVAVGTKGQVGVLLLLPLAVAWWLLERGRDGWAGVALGVAFAMKLFVGLFLLTLLAGRRRRAAATLAATSVGIYALGAAVLGWSQYIDHFGAVAAADLATWGGNASLLGTVSKLTNGVRGALLPVLHPLFLAPAACVLGYLFWAARRARTAGEIVGPTVVGMLVLSPLAWYYYLPALVLPLLVAWRAGGAARWIALLSWAVGAGELFPTPINLQTASLFGMLAAMVVMTAADARAGRPPGRSAPAAART